MTGHGSNANIGILVFYILLAITVGLVVLEIIKVDETPTVEVPIERIYHKDYVLEEWTPVMPEKTIRVISEDTIHISC